MAVHLISRFGRSLKIGVLFRIGRSFSPFSGNDSMIKITLFCGTLFLDTIQERISLDFRDNGARKKPRYDRR